MGSLHRKVRVLSNHAPPADHETNNTVPSASHVTSTVAGRYRSETKSHRLHARTCMFANQIICHCLFVYSNVRLNLVLDSEEYAGTRRPRPTSVPCFVHLLHGASRLLLLSKGGSVSYPIHPRYPQLAAVLLVSEPPATASQTPSYRLLHLYPRPLHP
jgi:hypothetical protein